MADTQFHGLGTENAPADWTLPGSLDLVLKAARAVYDGSSAAAAFLPCLTIISDSGNIVGQYVTGSQVAAGDAADVSFGPFLRGASASTGGGIAFDTYPQSGDWLYVETTEAGGTTPGGYGMELKDDGNGGIEIIAGDGEIQVGQASVGSGVNVNSSAGITLDNFGSSGQLSIESRSSDGILIEDTHSTSGANGIEVLSDNNQININAKQDLGLQGGDGATTGVVIKTGKNTNPSYALRLEADSFTLYADGDGSVPILKVSSPSLGTYDYEIKSGASWVADL